MATTGPTPAPVRVPTDWSRYARMQGGIVARFAFFLPMELAYRRLLRSARFDGPVSILELGCGTGTMSRRLAERLKAANVTLVDNNPAMLGIAGETFSGSPAGVVLTEHNVLTFADGEAYGLVHSGGLIEHFADRSRAKLVEVHARHTAKGGYCIIFVPTPSLVYRCLRTVREWLGFWIFTDEVPMRKEQLIREVEATGLRVLAATYFWRWYLTEVGVIAVKA